MSVCELEKKAELFFKGSVRPSEEDLSYARLSVHGLNKKAFVSGCHKDFSLMIGKGPNGILQLYIDHSDTYLSVNGDNIVEEGVEKTRCCIHLNREFLEHCLALLGG